MVGGLFLQADIQLLQKHLLDKRLILHGISFVLLLQISCYMCADSIPCSSDLCTYFLTSTNCFDYCGFTISLKFNLGLLFKILLAIPFPFHKSFRKKFIYLQNSPLRFQLEMY